MVERLGQRDAAREDVFRPYPIAGDLLRQPAHDMGANARIVTAERCAKVTVPRHVIGVDTDAAIGDRRGDIAAKKGGRPAAMVGLKQQMFVAGALRERHQLAGPFARQRRLAPEIGPEPEAPFRFV